MCGCATSGPSGDPERAKSIGMAAHITAAASGGPRYDEALTAEERRSADNGIWCCENCGDEVDDDHSTYTVPVLREKRRLAEEKAERLFAIRAERGPDLAAAELQARTGAREILGEWRSTYDFNHAQLVELDLWEITKETDRDREPVTWTMDRAVDLLAGGRRLVVQGRPGAGKTTTLLQCAEKLLATPNAPVPLIFGVSAWASSGLDLARHVADRLGGRGVAPDLVPLLLQTRRLALLLNGWNEAADVDLARTNARLRDFLLNYPGVAVAVTTREIANAPAMLGSTRLDLRPLSSAKKSAIIRAASLREPDAFFGELNRNRVLAEMTDTPLFLAAALKLVAAGRAVPSTRSALLGSILAELERTDNHDEMLRAGPAQGFHGEYLEEIAATMTAEARTSLAAASMQAALARCSDRLLASRRIGTAGATPAIAENLVQHHALVRQPEAAGSYAFVHQQVQEWFAAGALARRFEALGAAPSAEAVFRLQREILDQRQWREALDFTMENLVAAGQLATAARLVRWMMPVDLLAAAELCKVGGDGVWRQVGRELAEALRQWHRKGDVHASCALAAMLATGSPEFVDLFWPELEGDDQRLMCLCRQYSEFYLSSLGPNWQARVNGWPEQQQAVFLLELSDSPEPAVIDFAESHAISESAAVRRAALEVLLRRRAFRRLAAIISREDFEVWDERLHVDVLHRLPRSILEPFLDRIRGQWADASAPLRLRITETLERAGYADWLALAQVELTRLGGDLPTAPAGAGLRSIIGGYVRLVLPAAREWFLVWLTGCLSHPSGWEDPRQQRHFGDAVTGQIEHLSDEQRLTIARALLAAPELTPVVIDALRQLGSRMSAPSPFASLLVDAYVVAPADANRRGSREELGRILHELPTAARVDALIGKCAELTAFDELNELLNMLSAHHPLDRTLKTGLRAEQRVPLRTLIRRVAELQTDEERARHLYPHLAVMLGAIGDPADVELVAGWCGQEQERWEAHYQRHIEARRAGGLRRPGNFGVSYWNWYAGAFALFQCPASEEVMRGWLSSPHFIDEGAMGLVLFSRVEGSLPTDPDRPSERGPIVPRPLAAPDARVRVRADAILLAIERLEALPEPDQMRAYHLRRANVALASLNDIRARPRLLSSGNVHTGWEQIEAFRNLARNGHVLPGRAIAEALEPFFAASEVPHYNSGSDPWYAVIGGIAVLLVSDEPAVAVERIRRFPTARMHANDADPILNLLAASPAPAATECLLELSRSIPERSAAFPGLVEALAATDAGHMRLLELVVVEPPERTGLGRGAISVAAVQVGARDPVFRAALLPHIQDAANPGAYRLAGTASNLGTEDAFEALLAREDISEVEGDLAHWIENEMEDKIPTGHGGHYLAPTEASSIRRRLAAALLAAEPRKRAVASRLLARIQARRLRFGQPADEKLHPDIDRLPALAMPWPLLPDAE